MTTASLSEPGLPDAERNRILRRADWRFLLPTPAPRRSICFARGFLAEATAAVSESLVPGEKGGQTRGDCDLAVAADPSWATLRQAWEALRPGGVLYVEWNRGWPGPAGIRRRLELAGFEAVACYAPRPGPERGTEVWVPLEADGPVQYFLARQSRRQSGPRRVRQAVRGFLWQFGPRLRFAFPICSVARKSLPHAVHERGRRRASATGATARGLSPELEKEVLSRWEGWGFGPHPPEVASLLITRGRRSINKAVTLLFAGSDSRPMVAIKRPRVASAADPMWNEARVLRAVHDRAGGIPGAPRVLFCQVLDGFLTLAETFVAGRPMAELLGTHNYRALALQATDWSAGLAQNLEPVPREVWWGRLVEPVVSQFEQAFGPVLDPGVFREALTLLGSLGPLPLVCEQRDFSPWNLVLAPDRGLGVLDWESAEIQGVPALDLIYYLTYLSSYLDGSIHTGDLRVARRRSLDPTTDVGALARECLNRYLGKLGLPDAPVTALAVLAWMIHARSDYRHFCLDLGTAPDPAMLRTSRFLRLWYQELGAKPAW